MSGIPMLCWERDQPQILGRLGHRSKLKICCKTVNEPELVLGWLEHHGAIVGLENLIIADNGSDDFGALETYSRFADKVTIFQFSGNHNDIHWHPRFGPLFEALKASSDHFAFFDVDERLIWIEGGNWSANSNILEAIREFDSIYPATWLINAIGSSDKFNLLDTERRPILTNNLKYGKPILTSKLIGAQAGIHNIQYAGNKYSSACAGQLFLLHLTQFPDQRIDANVKKLANRGLVERSIDPQVISSMDFSSYPDKTVLRFQNEIVEMLAYKNGDRTIEAKETEYLNLTKNGAVNYSNDEARMAFSKFVEDAPSVAETIFA
ncbi:glycosyltransferase family 2 protein [Rhodopseudomonas sp. HC1]|uniref:glycosyltransferase family 2 protein n=1 Tax=Rhodopseudomonas infernalis TaxID=2897386 RepID=UPI001EE86121|nr:glycosyltransferase family 2 protein [Rhodopseudomonas infernalis]MCG6205521.1 glycosyltransferase family 2 protein [Rhodopseudomonas infernalis]